MTRIAWGTAGERYFEAGADQGVLYVNGVGVPWNGLTGVSEDPDGGDPQPYYVDGYKYLNLAAAEEFKATINAFSSPSEFGQCDGTVAIHNGLFATQQPRKSFDMSYRTKVGNDISGIDHGYKIHLVYNALAAPSTRENNTTGDKTDPLGLSWGITTTPPRMDGMRPTAHLVIDSRVTPPNLMSAIEDILYGNDDADPRLPTQDELITLFNSDGPLLYTNLVTNPSFETLSTYLTIRTNLVINPEGGTLGGAAGSFRIYQRWFGSGGVGTTNWVSSPGAHGSLAYVRKTWTTAPTGNNGGDIAFDFAQGGTAAVACAAGDVHTIAYSWRASATSATMTFNRFIAQYYDATGAALGGSVVGSSFPAPTANVWQDVSGTFTAPTGAAFVMFYHQVQFGSAIINVGFTLDGSAPIVEKSASTLGFFSGASTMTDPDLQVGYNGTANASTSYMRGTITKNSTSASSISSTAWSKSGTHSLRVIPKNYSNGAINTDTYCGFGGDVGGIRHGMEAGKTYTVLATIHLEAAQIGSLNANARLIKAFTRIGTDAYVSTVSVQAQNTPGDTDLRVTFTVPSNASEAFIRLYNGASFGNGDVWFDNFAIVEGVYTGPYFDGNTVDALAIYKWTGATDDSTSTMNSWY